jgi:glycosyltransferase involved in cell wall biosynthesis
VETLWDDEPARARLVAAGRARVARFTWRESALRFRALYRIVAGRATREDRALIEAAPLL